MLGFSAILSLTINIFIYIICFQNGIYADMGCDLHCKIYVSESYEEDSGSYYCDENCQEKQCSKGCDLLENVVKNELTCQESCTQNISQGVTGQQESSVLQSEKQRCIQGCSVALDRYFLDVKNHFLGSLLTLPAPKPVLPIQHSHIVLYMDLEVEENATFHLLQKVVDPPQVSTDWQLHLATELVSGPTRLNKSHLFRYQVNVTNLHPYVMYQFKVIIPVTRVHALESEESAQIRTASHGVPSDAPKITNVRASSPNIVSVAWSPPLYTNGPLLGYSVSLRPVYGHSLHTVISDVKPNSTAWTFGSLHSSELYEVAVIAVNEEGEGPVSLRNVTTPSPGNLSQEEMPYLILGADNMVVKQHLMELTREAEKIVTKPESILITGVGLHYQKDLLFVSDSSGQVARVNLSTDTQTNNVYPSLSQPHAIAVDWLSDLVYIISGQRVYRCSLYEDDCLVAIDIAPQRPLDVKVDPLNGFLYFTTLDLKKGLYRVDLASLTDLPASDDISPLLILKGTIQTIIVDHSLIQLYYANDSYDTMMSAFLDGTGRVDIRNGLVARPNFMNVTSMVYHDRKFYWTNRTKVYHEDYDAGNRTYYHNSLLLFEQNFCGFNLYYPGAQPIPAPYNPPARVQAVFTAVKVIIDWDKPAHLLYQGAGAYNQWDYEVQVTSVKHPTNQIQHVVRTGMTFETSNLEPDSEYHIKVRAFSPAGTGPWSDVFVGRTLKDEHEAAKLLLAIPYQLKTWQIGEMGMDGRSFLPLAETDGTYEAVSDLTWYEDLVFWTTEDGELFVYRNETDELLNLYDLASDVSCIAFDWLGEKLYWSVRKHGVIRRSDLAGSKVDFVYQALARDMAIDSLNGRLYWTTITSLESGYLNGDDTVVYFSVPYFSGKQVISLTLNSDLEKVFWYVKGFENQQLYMADLVTEKMTSSQVVNSVKLLGNFKDIDKFSVLQYFSHRLLWLNEDGRVTVGNTECNYTSIITDPLVEVKTFIIKDPSLHQYPAGLDRSTLKVIPDAIPASSVQCIGTWKEFNVTWNASEEVNHGKVFYEVSVQSEGRVGIVEVTQHAWYEVRDLPPFTPLLIKLRAYTYWGYGPLTETTIKSPMSIPTKPQTPRVYVTQRENAATANLTLAADFRWSDPETINGVLSSHKVIYWKSTSSNLQTVAHRSASTRHFILEELQEATTYYFQVQSCTPVGCSLRSDVVSAMADAINPVPKILLATRSSIKLADADNINKSSVTIETKSAVAMEFLAQEERTFWIGSDKYLDEHNGSHITKLLHIEGEPKDMCLDWISRTLYILESTSSSWKITTHSLDRKEQGTILQTDGIVGSVIVDPYTSLVMWSEEPPVGGTVSGGRRLMSSSMDGTSVSTLFGPDGRKRRSLDTQCTCPSDPGLSFPLALDLSQDGRREVIFVDEKSWTIYAADVTGCKCSALVVASPSDRKGLPPDLLTVDHVHLYWYNKGEGQLYIWDKKSRKVIEVTPLPDLQDIKAYGAHLQPLPSSECLDPETYEGTINVTEKSNTSIKVSLEAPVWPDSCRGISHPSTRFSLFYKKLQQNDPSQVCGPSGHSCQKQSSYEQNLTLSDLEPYSFYLLQGAISNYYTEYFSESLGEAVVIRTRPGVPSPVDSVDAKPVSPNSIQVSWHLPNEPNGPLEEIVYYVKRATQGSGGSSDEYRTDVITYDQLLGRSFTYILTGLKPNRTYSIEILSKQNIGEHLSMSVPVNVRTFQLPGDIVFTAATNTSIMLSWRSLNDGSIVRHTFVIAEIVDGLPLWQNVGQYPIATNSNTLYNETFEGLRPNTEYMFRLRVVYNISYRIYLWPPDGSDVKFTYRTLTGIPDCPDPPVIEELRKGFEVSWLPPEDNGEPVTNYILEYRQTDKSNWSLVMSGNKTRWVVNDSVLQPGFSYMFRVAAENSNGWGNFSANSSDFFYPLLAEKEDDKMITIVAVAAAFIFIIIFIIIITVCFVCRRKNEEKKKARQFIAVPRGPDMELATLRELPMTAIQQNNTLYAINLVPTDDEIAALPHFRRNQLVLCKFLGSGAFGEVFEGVAKNILSDTSGDTKVAVKTLRKSASDQEKEEFLKEALLMSNFRHEHILSLLGVCLDNDPQFIILELMEGGDLLSFMRTCRPSSLNPAVLSLTDLVKVCVHVARGCKYLEDMHFVHRDLAARNCLVSSTNPATMAVKIGDFGLARDIYKNDYYRKEGEGLLPVRWMSPESLVDGVFTTQSDIWAFGVLMWEVITFGQQPYPARTNIEVLHYVRSGGRLDRPANCPNDLYQLMCKCWSYASEDRPAFSYFLQQLEQFQEACASISEYLVPIRSTATANESGVDNFAFGDVEGGESLDEWQEEREAPLSPRAEAVTPPEEPGEEENRRSIPPSPRCPRAADGYKPQNRRQRLTSTSSDGPEYYGMQGSKYLRHTLYGKIKRATSFDSPEPKDATREIITDASNYIEPRSGGMPMYIELIPDSKAENYMYNSKGERVLNKGDNCNRPEESQSVHEPSYVQTTVKENNYSCETDLKKCKTETKEMDSDSGIVYSSVSPPKYLCDAADSRIYERPELYNDAAIAGFNMNGYRIVGPRKQRLSSNTSCMSFDSVQTEPPYSCSDFYHKNANYSTISSNKSNCSVSNISSISEHVSEHLDSSNPSMHQYWANSNISLAHGKLPFGNDIRNHTDYLNMSRRAQVYPENAGVLAGYDMVQASLV